MGECQCKQGFDKQDDGVRLEIYKESNRSNSSSTYINFVNAAWIANQV